MSRAERIEAMKKHYGKQNGRVTLAECQICGHFEWVSTATKEPSSIFVVSMDSHCRQCSEVFYRAPEIASWVLNVINKNNEDESIAKAEGGAG